jgi:hypothetical protein
MNFKRKTIMKKAIFSVLCFVAWQVGHAQLTFTPNASLNAICPLVSTTFTINNIPVGCTQYTISLVSGDLASNTTFEVSNNQFTLSAADTPQEMVVRIIPIGGAPCIGQQDFKIPVRSINGQAPTFTGCQDIVIGRSESFNLTAILEYLYAGTSDQKEVAEYEWEIFAGGNNWNLTTINQQGVLRKIAQIVTDIQSDATIRARAVSHCGRVSDFSNCIIVRFVEPPCPIIGGPEFVVCEDTAPIGMLATVPQGLQGYTFHWTYPSGWIGTPQGPAGVVSPNGLNGGQVRLEARAFGRVSSPCIKEINLEPIEPSTMLVGDNFLCEDQQGLYLLNIPPPPNSTTTWVVTPSNATVPSAGTGISALIAANSGFNGNASIKFSVNTICNLTAERSRTFFVGKPIISNVAVNSQMGTIVQICPNDGLGSHYITLTVAGDFDNCVEWNDFGTTQSSHSTCSSFDFTLQSNPNNYPPYNTVFVNAIASNECGLVSQNIIAVPSYLACRNHWYEFRISPNPASTTVDIELHLYKDLEIENAPFQFIEVANNQGNIILTRTVENDFLQLDVSHYPDGFYYIRTTIENQPIIGKLLIMR